MITVTAENRQPLLEKFEANVFPVTESGCWIWMGSAPGFGHGFFGNSSKEGQERAHRVAWRLFRSDIPKGKWVLHHCDIPQCVNPDHLYIGTHQDNVRDRVVRKRGRSPSAEKTHCVNGHEFNLENTRIRAFSGRRECRTCHRKREGARFAAKKAARTHCVNGHEFTADNILIDVRGYRHCLTCKQENGRRWRESQMEMIREIEKECRQSLKR